MTEIQYCPECSQPVLADLELCNHCGGEVGPGLDRADVWHKLQSKLAKATEGKYEVEGLVGYGGMAGVYLARDTHLNRPVALKLVSPAVVMDPKMVRRFRQEAQTMAQLNHRHIVPVFDIQESEDLLFIVMQYVPGRTLAEVVTDARESLEPELVATWMVQISDALAHAHGRPTPVIHRDIKPSNILLDETGQAQLADFGIAKVQGDSGLTRTGHLIGTPAYMSPEQCRGESITAASDQYSLGTVAYELLAGVPPFRGPTLMVLQAHSAEQPKTLSSTRPGCPPILAGVIERMLAKNPEERWAGMAEVSRELTASIEAMVSPERLKAWSKRVREIGLDSSPSPLTLGTSERLIARLLDGDGEELVGRRIHWSSTNGGVASVTAEGVVGAKSVGSAVIVGRSGRAVTTLEVEVVPPTVERIEVTPSKIEVFVGEEVELVVEGFAASGDPVALSDVVWEVDDPQIVHVIAGEAVQGRSPGQAVLTVTQADVRQQVPVSVRPVPVAALRIGSLESALNVGDQAILTCRVEDAAGEELLNREVEWSSSDQGVVGTDRFGKVFAIAPGMAVVHVVCEGTSGSASIEVVLPGISEVRIPVGSIELVPGETYRLSATVTDVNGRSVVDRPIEWTASDTSVATVTKEGEVEAVAAGSTSLTVECEGASAQVLVVVRSADRTVVIPRPQGFGTDHTQVLQGVDWGVPPDLSPPDTAQPEIGLPDVSALEETVQPTAGPSEVSTQAAPSGPAQAIPDAEKEVEGLPEGAGLTGSEWQEAVAKAPPPNADKTGIIRPGGGAEPVETPRPPASRRKRGAAAGRNRTWALMAMAGGAAGALGLVLMQMGRGGGPADPLSVPVVPQDTTVRVGDQFQFRVGLAADELTSRNPVWASSNPLVATVSPGGRVEARGAGTASVSLTGDGVVSDGPWNVTVIPRGELAATGPTEAPPAGVVYRELQFDPVPSEVPIGSNVSVTAWLVDQENQRTRATLLRWSSTNPAVLRSTGSGGFRAVAPGDAALEAGFESSGLRRSALLVVVAAPETRPTPEAPVVTRVDIADTGGELRIGDVRSLNARVVDQGGRAMLSEPLTWASTSPGIVSVDATGRITGVSSGSAWVIAARGSFRDSVEVSVPSLASAFPTVGQAAALIEEFTTLLGSGDRNRILALIPPADRGNHERYVSFASDGRLEPDGDMQSLTMNGLSATFTLPVRARTSFGGWRSGTMDFVAQLVLVDGAWRLGQLIPTAGSAPP